MSRHRSRLMYEDLVWVCKISYTVCCNRGSIHTLTDTTFKGVKQFAQKAVWNLLDVHDTILEHRIEQLHYSNKCCKPSVEYQINDLVYLSTKNLALPKHRA